MKIEAPSQRLLVPELNKVPRVSKAAKVEQPQEQAATVRLTDQVKVLGNKAMVADVGELQAAQEAKVQAVKARVQAGSYQVTARELAEKMLSRSDKS